MFLAPEYAWFEPVLIASIVVFIIDLVGASIAFGNPFFSALISAIVFALVFGALRLFRLRQCFHVGVDTPQSSRAGADTKIEFHQPFGARDGCGVQARIGRFAIFGRGLAGGLLDIPSSSRSANDNTLYWLSKFSEPEWNKANIGRFNIPINRENRDERHNRQNHW